MPCQMTMCRGDQRKVYCLQFLLSWTERSWGNSKLALHCVMSSNLPEMPPLRVRSSLRYTRKWAFAEVGAVASDRQSHVDTDLNETPTAGYALMNLKLGFTYRKFSGSFTLENMLDRFYYEYLSYYRDPFASGVKIPEPGRNFFAHLRYSF